MTRNHHSMIVYTLFVLALFSNFLFWTSSSKILPKWDNVPPAPSLSSLRMTSLGDPEIAYRMVGYFLQNTGNTGGNFESLKNYDYALLERWLSLTIDLDDRSNFVPFLAAYYFGALDDMPEKTRHLVKYLEIIGQADYPQQWRWLAQAVYQARYKMGDNHLALQLANKLANLNQDVAPWGRQMPAFVQLEMGNKQAAYELMRQMLISDGDKLHPNEVNFMIDFICTRTLTKDESRKDPICQDIK